MQGNDVRIKSHFLVENSIFTVKSVGGRFAYLYRLLRNLKTYVYADSYFPECTLKSRQRIFLDQLKHVLKHGEINKFYFVFGLDRKDKADYNKYISHEKFIHVRDKINSFPPVSECEYKPYKLMGHLRDMWSIGAFCSGVGVPSPANIGLIEAGTIRLLQKKETLPLSEIINLNVNAFCKVFNGGQGRGLFTLEIKEKVIYQNGEEISFEKLVADLGTEKWILQEKIINQHEVLSALHSKSINTIRLMTVCSGDSVEVIGALLRIGCGEGRIDNWAAGGVLVVIDTETGKLNKWGYFKPGYGKTKVDRHPDSNIVFEGLQIPFFEEAVKQAKYLHSLLYRIHSIGWDIGITSEGPVFIEGNDNWDVAFYQLVNGGAIDKFKETFEARLKAVAG